MSTIYLSTPTPEDWRSRAACLDADPEVFYPPGESYPSWAVAEARRYCGRCSVSSECLQEALDKADDHGIRAATTPDDRRRIRRTQHRRRVRALRKQVGR